MRTPLIKVLLRIFSWLPLPVNHALGASLGLLACLVPNRPARITRINLDLCLPELSARQRKQLARRSMMESGKTITELGAMWYWKPDRLVRLIKKVSGEDILKSAIHNGQGVLFLTPHLGAWELTSLYMAHESKIGLTCLYRPARITGLNNLMRHARERTGAKLVPTNQAGVKALYRALNSNEAAGILPDQVPGGGQGTFAPFFGIPAETMALVSRLAKKTDASVIFIYAERLPFGAGYNIHLKKAPPGIIDTDSITAATALNQGVEACVRQLPEQYQWSYKRFRTRPEGEESVY